MYLQSTPYSITDSTSILTITANPPAYKMTVIEITSEEQFEEILRANQRVAVDFMATWCGPCRLISPVFKQLSEQFKDIVFVSVDVDKVAPVAQKYGVRAMPTFIMFKDGNKCDDMMGANKVGLEDKITGLAA
ncbi:thioredoxin domain-containing protein [Hirsutella rhossiliensis]|uniref:Thioredoxin domain-containing protein n=1 Tax=Hirsutella rhossiliensis TaxID=111463 RepID=A0A9P8N9U1_9HYPO|nr:thioredoxin domain-containing protein [Hirsutella rhossiliensis]KAH0968636.1 thioredoxin domain-containing protein [Hirsutella rhossiliensis]